MKLSQFFGRFFGHTKHPQTIDRAELLEMLLKLRRPTFITVEATTIPRAKCSKDGTITKQQTCNGCIGFIYSKSVNRRRKKEGKEPNFEAEPRKWGERVGNVVFYREAWYIEMAVQKVVNERYFLDGIEISKSELEFPLKKEGEKQNLDKPVIIRDFSLGNISRIRMFGKDLKVLDKITRNKKRAYKGLAKIIKNESGRHKNRRRIP